MIARTTTLFLIFVSVFASAHADIDLLNEIYGSQSLATIAGNGRLTVGVDPRGRVALCRWPSPGLQDQLTSRNRVTDTPGPSADPGYGLQWGIEIDGERLWLTDERWNTTQQYGSLSSAILRTTSRLQDSPIVLTQTIAVQPGSDVLILQLAATGLDTPPRIFWHANFSPVTRKPLPELPVAGWFAESLNDFAAFTDNSEKAVYHFRPRNPGRRDWQLAEQFAREGASPEQWRSFGDGTWISYASPQATVAAHCGTGLVPPDAAVQDHLREGHDDTAAVGECYSIVEFAPKHENNRFVTTLYIAFGDSAQSVRALRREALATGYDALVQNTNVHWMRWLETAHRLARLEPQSSRLFDQALLTLAACTDAQTGAIVRSPSTQPPLARDWPRHGAWMTYALDLAGYTAMAEKHTLFYLDAVRTADRPGEPAGSLPHALYPDGTPAAPHVFLDTQAVAWTLWSIHRHSTFIEGTRQLAYLRKVWDTVVLSTEFLVGWSDARRGAPLHSFDPATLRDMRSNEVLATTRLGLIGALGIAEALGKTPPKGWTRRLGELDALLQNLLMNPAAAWELGEALPFALENMLDPNDPRLDEAIKRRLQALPDLDGHAAAKALSDVAILWRNDRRKLAGLKSVAIQTLTNVLSAPAGDERGPAYPDALTAAHAVIALALIHQQPQ